MENPYNDIMVLIDKRRIKKALKKLRVRLNAEPENIFFMEYLSVCLQLQGRYEEAIETCKRAMQIDPHYLPIQIELVNSYICSGKRELAKELMGKLRTEDLDSNRFRITQIKYYLQVNDLNEAEILADKAINETPTSVETHYLKGVIHLRLGAKIKASQEFLQIFRLNKSIYYFVLLIESLL